ncbi:MAG TPA: OmpA family protein [Thermodesulfobacteriota bacterium]|nr:OmpA family protein [Deltaproteobacteria bacterium]HNR11861.1 OmpA family protein [Thermodesulfobacteriota bacterium]HNU70744.1 OmpA family protein [Thermodesulfobacteriota bacterium]HOC38922.1 OmpA family protein [Thermodesulfobacteriota bacterium]HQO78498.1 OmpA family protein [Thermodesulfobacteriota bacterium]
MARRIICILCVIVLVGAGTGCANRKKTAIGAGAGAAAGAGVGAIIGHQSGHKGGGALIGAATGALIGSGIGYYLDRQADELRQIQALEEVRQEGDRLVATMSGQLLFEVDSSILKASAVSPLTEIAGVLNRYPDSKIVVKGYTDSTGDESHNQTLSENRAKSVGNVLISKGVDPSRVSMLGFGEQFPVADNSTPEGRAQNRRVELEIIPTQSAK